MIKNLNSENLHLHYILCFKFSEAQLFQQQIIKGVIKGDLFDYTSYYFHTYDSVYSFMALLSTASVCLIPVIKCEFIKT